MNIPFFDLTRQHQHIKGELEMAILSTIDSGWFIMGEQVAAFEGAFASYTGSRYCIGCANGTDALELALEALGIGPGDEVVVPAFGWMSPALAVLRVGASPVFADIAAEGFNVSAKGIAEKISPKTKAVIVIHLFGAPCDIVQISKLCQDNGIRLIEDCAQAHGSRVGGKHVGTFGDIGTFSFYPTKNLGAMGDAGCVLTQDSVLATKVRALANYGKVGGSFERTGRNSRMDELQAAILLVKLKYLERWNERRREIAKIYTDSLNTENVKCPPPQDGSVFYQYVIRSAHRDELQRHLEKNGIATMVHYPFVVPCLPAFGALSLDDFPNSRLAVEEVLSLPVFTGLTEEEVGYVINKIRSFNPQES